MDDLAMRIQQLRRERNWSQEQLGEQVGVSRQAVSKWESGAAVPDVENCLALSRAFGIPIGVFLGEAAEESTVSPQKVENRKSRLLRRLPWGLCALLAAVCLALGWQGWQTRQANQRLAAGMTAILPLTNWGGEGQYWTPVAVDWAAETVTIQMTVTPTVYAGGSAAFLLYPWGEEEPKEVPASWNGRSWTAEAELPLDRGWKLEYRIEGGGVRQQSLLDGVQVNRDDLEPVPDGVQHMSYHYDQKANILGRGELYFDMPDWNWKEIWPEITEVRAEVRAGDRVIAQAEGEAVRESALGDLVYEWDFGGLPRPVGETEQWTVVACWRENGAERTRNVAQLASNKER